MHQSFHIGNRNRLYEMLESNSVMLLFSGKEVRKTNDEFYPFHASRHFVYLTGIAQKESILLAVKDAAGSVRETLYLLPHDLLAERWTGTRLTFSQAENISGVSDIKSLDAFEADIHKLLALGGYGSLYLDLYRAAITDRDTPAHEFLRRTQQHYPFMNIRNADQLVRKLRLIKQPCEIEALYKAEEITRDGILRMMRNGKPGMWEYQLKSEWEYAISQYAPIEDGFPPIISAGQNNFCIHYYSYSGQAQDGDMALCDVGALWEGLTTDVSRGFPVNGKFSPKQKLLFDCALETSNHMFSLVKPGMKMADVDRINREYCAQLLVDCGALDDVKNVSKLMWHGGAHHIGWDVHDVVETPEIIAPGMAFCVDVGIYHEEWGIGFRLEDNCLVTENGCENLSRDIPRTTEDIEAAMRG